TCEPQKKIMFMKTHKTAGTSVMNIIERFAWRNNLTIALPNGGNADQFNYPNMFDAKRMVYPLLPWEREFDVICHHMRFNMKETNKTLPRNTTKYVTMLREPGKLFESIFDYYYELVDIFHAVPSSSHDHLSQWLDKAPTLFKRRGYWFMGKNMAFYDLGFQNERESEEYLKSAVEKMERDFDLVMITDHFLESLILLKDLMCWDTVDLISLKLNARKTSSKDQEPELREKIRNWNKADTYLFDHFNATLWRKVDAFGRQKMAQEIAELKQMNSEFFRECVNVTGFVDANN
uniref:Galactosylceramide sulfotransferase n=1 Tax=Ciona savignyi TaxID=51511 RepID=H2Z1W9_CIOSA